MSYYNNLFKVIIGCVFFCIAFISSTSQSVLAQNNIEWHSFEDAIQIADSTNKPIFVDVWAAWCGWCHKMNKEVYPLTQKTLTNNFVLTKLNRDDNQAHIRYKGRKVSPFELAKTLQTESVPAIVILSPNGDYVADLSGFIKAEKLEPILSYISSESSK